MVIPWLSALVLVVLGFTVQVFAVRGRGRPEFLVRRDIHPRRWGIHVMAAGTMLALDLWTLNGSPWPDLGRATRIAVVLSGFWAVVSLGIAVLPLLAPGSTDNASPTLSEPRRPRSHGLFLLLGMGLSIWLVWMTFTG